MDFVSGFSHLTFPSFFSSIKKFFPRVLRFFYYQKQFFVKFIIIVQKKHMIQINERSNNKMLAHRYFLPL